MFRWWVAAALACLSLTAPADVLHVGFGTHKPPYIYEGERRGLEYELIERAAQNAGFEVTVYYAPMERLHLMLRRGEIDAIATTHQRSGVKAYYSQTYIYYHNVAVALARRGYRIEHIADLGNYSVSAFQRARLLLGPEFERMALNNPRYREEALQINRNRLLYSGRVDVVVGDKRILRYFNREVADQVDVTQALSWFEIFPPTPYRVGFRLDRQRQRFDEGLRKLRESGEYQRIEQRYLAD
ncbi:Membrane-bound lytic murein transglycosylase F [Pseudomonas sp. THAF187a]|uniref:substrate-binding periplasmic protein n=1 Tax=Pseudomonadaceae TaxID=135621 RepID=UPI0012694DEF|nr:MULTISPECIES: transporter substrate-binding domain-containing protein [unclassified Pseudomonas]QFT23338.1 Membrane-bound lytic murein transglycosylase F [Pseudomonas sp. THAF187a]QFT43526.1 Membrane-bound lytic murein transglycosylase F [Pseudomonas sp. THAF42]WFC63678.1 transporter substrate-binding domain-containing protein [Pseudomonas sp. REST10]